MLSPMVGYVYPHKVVARRNAFLALQVHKMEVIQKVGQKVEGWSTNFHKWKGIRIYKKSLN